MTHRESIIVSFRNLLENVRADLTDSESYAELLLLKDELEDDGPKELLEELPPQFLFPSAVPPATTSQIRHLTAPLAGHEASESVTLPFPEPLVVIALRGGKSPPGKESESGTTRAET